LEGQGRFKIVVQTKRKLQGIPHYVRNNGVDYCGIKFAGKFTDNQNK